jgi:ElaB/YqjD/DUF883 family membrane-anchored ribosome-binding protein
MDSSLLTTEPPAQPSPAPSVDLGELKSAAEHALEDAKVKFDALLKDGCAYVQANPGKSILAALGAGFVLGMVFKD